MPIGIIRRFIQLESFGGILLMFATLLALLVANSPASALYQSLLSVEGQVRIGNLGMEKPLLLWINDGLMAVFFLLVGLEVKREMLEGELSSLSQVVLPGIAALGGMLVPALIYVAFNRTDPVALNGWAIPAATDIAFALGILLLLGNRVHLALKVLLLTIAIFDDLGAILLIALFFSGELSWISLISAGLAVIVLIVWNLLGVTRTAAYAVVGVVLWVFVLQSGVHATLAGVILAFAIPIRSRDHPDQSPLRDLEHALHPWVAYGILPIFAFANAGVSLEGVQLGSLLQPVPLGIFSGLFIGKQVGVFGFSWAGVKLGIVQLPLGMNWLELYGVATLCGVGFTMSLFIASLAFEHVGLDYGTLVRLGILAASLLSGLWGFGVLRYALRGETSEEEFLTERSVD